MSVISAWPVPSCWSCTSLSPQTPSSALLLEQAKEAVRKSRDFAPSNGEHFTAAECETLGRLRRDAYLACEAAGTTIAAERRQLWEEERQAFRAALLRGEVAD